MTQDNSTLNGNAGPDWADDRRAGGEERLVAVRTVDASPERVFAVLADPARHQDTEPGDWVRDAVDPRPITAVGQLFAINMYHPNVGGDGTYVMVNKVTVFEPNRTIEWLPGQPGENGAHDPGGWTWRYDLADRADGGTDVTLTYDWSATPQVLRQHIGPPPFGVEFLDESLGALADALDRRGPLGG
ncbi:SRPBCC family protein [Gordonia sinesedis]